MHNTGQPPEDGQRNVDDEVGAAAALEEHGERRDEDGEEVEADVATGGGHRGR